MLNSRNQRERLLGAAVAAFADKGYDGTRVADVLAIAGVSRQTFYQHFANKHECYMATLDSSLKMAGAAMLAGYERTSGTWNERLEAMLQLLMELVIAQPAAFRMALVEVHAAGRDALELLETMSDGVERSVMSTLRDSPDQSGLPREAVRGILAGVRKMIYTRVREGREDELPALVPGMLEWALCYRTPPEPLRQPHEVPAALAAVRPPDADGRQRILYAVTDLVAARGYRDVKISDIAERAAVSLTTFYGYFDGKEEAFLATLADAQQRLLEATLPAYMSTDDWPRAIGAASRAFMAFLATDPTTAQLGGVEAWASGRAGLELRAQGLANFRALLDEGFRRYPDTPPIAGEAIAASIDSLLFDQLRRAGADRLYEVAPVGVFLSLAPFIGSDAAAEAANEAAIPSLS